MRDKIANISHRDLKIEEKIFKMQGKEDEATSSTSRYGKKKVVKVGWSRKRERARDPV